MTNTLFPVVGASVSRRTVRVRPVLHPSRLSLKPKSYKILRRPVFIFSQASEIITLRVKTPSTSQHGSFYMNIFLAFKFSYDRCDATDNK